jgi:hypothetical protein
MDIIPAATSIGTLEGYSIQDPLRLKSWFQIEDILSDDRAEGTVYLANVLGQRMVAKTNYDWRCLRYEYLVGAKINTAQMINYITTYGLFLVPNVDRKPHYGEYVSYLLIEYVDGDIIDKYRPLIDEATLVQMLYQLCLALQLAQERLQFAHNDLHAGNVMIEPLRKERQLIYPLQRETVTITSEYLVRIIDYGYSHIQLENIPNDIQVCMAFENCENGVIPAVFDPIYDILYFAMSNFVTPYIEDQYKICPDIRLKRQASINPEDQPSIAFYKFCRRVELTEGLYCDGGEKWDILLSDDKFHEYNDLLRQRLLSAGYVRDQLTDVFPFKRADGYFVYPPTITPINQRQYLSQLDKAYAESVHAITSPQDARSKETIYHNMAVVSGLLSGFKQYRVNRRSTRDIYGFIDLLRHYIP